MAEQDVIRNAFIYDPSTVQRVGASKVLVDSAPFANAREPLAQAFKAVGAPDCRGVRRDHQPLQVQEHHAARAAATSTPARAASTPTASAQATALADFADAFQADRGIDKVFLTGDFNSYSHEDPMQVLYGRGLHQAESDQAGEHVATASAACPARSTTSSPTRPRSSDRDRRRHLGHQRLGVGRLPVQPVQLQRDRAVRGQQPVRVLRPQPGDRRASTPRIARRSRSSASTTSTAGSPTTPSGDEAGAAVLSGAVEAAARAEPRHGLRRGGRPDRGVDVRVVHPAGQADHRRAQRGRPRRVGGGQPRVRPGLRRPGQPRDGALRPVTNRVRWCRVGVHRRQRRSSRTTGNRRRSSRPGSRTSATSRSGSSVRSPSTCPSWSRPAGIADIEVTDIVEATNAAADRPQGRGRRHRRAARPRGCGDHGAVASAIDPASDFGKIVNGVNTNVDAIISGHTHLAYNHAIPVPPWANEGRPVTKRPVVSAGQYGINLNQLRFQRRRRHRRAARGPRRTCVDLKARHRRAELPGRPGGGRHRRRRRRRGRRPRRPAAGRDRGAVQPGEARPTARRRTVAASPPWATWSPRCSGGRPSRRRRGRRRSPS